MTRETKLGLIIGGAFILCFSLILSNTENEVALDRQIAAMMPPGPDQPDPSSQMAGGYLRRQLVGYTPPNVEPPLPTTLPIETRSEQLGAGPAQAAPVGESTEVEDLSPATQDMTLEPLEVPAFTMRQSPPTAIPPSHSEVTDAIANRPLPKSDSAGRENPDPVVNLADLQDHDRAIDIVVPKRTRTKPPKTQPAEPQPRPTPRRVQVYVVAKNDNLTKIARKFYGKPATSKGVAQYVDLIFQANREALKDRNSVHAGQTLRIPLIDDAKGNSRSNSRILAKSGSNATKSKAARAGTNGSNGKKWRWYQVKPKDRYARIAKEQLGDAKRWKDIFELNKDIFPNPDQIRPGVRIRLPG